MSILVLNPGGRTLSYCLFSHKDELLLSATISDYRKDNKQIVMRRIKQCLAANEPDIITIRVSYGGNIFSRPALMNDRSVAELQQLIPQAPFHIPVVLGLANAAKNTFPEADVVFVFETAFFSNLPLREQVYAISPELTLPSQRIGFHGLMHEAACRYAAARMPRDGFIPPVKTLSICLEPRPESAAAIGLRPVMATGGATPLEGLPGDTSCGDLDIGIIIKLGQELDWGPEQLNKILTGESGFSGMLKRPITLGEIFTSDQKDCKLVRKLILYKLLQVCGTAMAAMETIDCIIFSGRYCQAGNLIGPWLLSKLGFMVRKNSEPRLTWEIMEQPIEKILAETAKIFVIENKVRAALV